MASVRISDCFMNEVKICAKANFRSVGKQIEYWAKIGKAAEENPDLNVDFIKDCFDGIQEMKDGKTTKFEFSNLI